MAKRQNSSKVGLVHPTAKEALWAREVLLRVGIDAKSSDARRWLPKMTKEVREISDEVLDDVRRRLKAEEPGKSFNTMSELRYMGASLLLDDPIGRQALRKAMRNLPREQLLEVLDFREAPRRPR
jgi:hypothetical protein